MKSPKEVFKSLKDMGKTEMAKVLTDLEDAQEQWRKNHPRFAGTPWDYFSLESMHEDRIWLNPGNQQHLNYGWLTVQDLRDWLNGTPGAVIKSKEHWDELLYMCSMSHVFSIGYNLEHFNLHPAKYLLPTGERLIRNGKTEIGTGFPKRMLLPDSKLSPEMIEAVEGHVKWLIHYDFNDQISLSNTSIMDLQVSRTCSEEIYGFFFALRCLGLEIIKDGACNIPAVRENFAWWIDLLKHEAKWEFLIENGIGYEPWIKNKKSLYSSEED